MHSPTWIDGVFVYWPLEAGEWHNKCVVIPEEDLVAVDPYSGKDLDACRLVTVTDIDIVLDDDGQPIYPMYEYMHSGITNLERAAARGKERRNLLRR